MNNFPPIHPADILIKSISSSGITKEDIASFLHISKQHLFNLINKKTPISPNMAIRLGKLFGNGTSFWLQAQAEYDAWEIQTKIDVSEIPTIGDNENG